MRRMRGVAAVAVAVAVLGAAGCGSKGSGGGSGDFVAKANQICADRSEKIDALGQPATNADIAELAAKVQSINGDALKQLQALKAPADAKDTADDLWSMIEAQNVDLGQLESAATMDDDGGVDKITTKLDDRGEEFDTKAESIGLTKCTADGQQPSSSSGTTTAPSKESSTKGTAASAADQQAFLKEAFASLQTYFDAYLSNEPEKEIAASAKWAKQLAGIHKVESLTSSAQQQAPEEGNLKVDLTGFHQDGSGWTLEGDIALTFGGTTYTYTDMYLERDDAGDLVVADYCRSNPEKKGPIDGCLSNSVGYIGQKATSDDGSLVVNMGPFLRTQGFGPNAITFSVYVQNNGSSPVSPVGGLQISYRTVSGDSGSAPSDAVSEMDVAPPGGTASGFITLNQPGQGSTGSKLEQGTLSLTFKSDAGATYSMKFTVPALPQSLS